MTIISIKSIANAKHRAEFSKSCLFSQSDSLAQLYSALLFLLFASIAHAEDYEPLPLLTAKSLFPDIALKTEHYEVMPQVSTDGFLTRTVIKYKYGEFEAVGPGMLKIRLNEIEALTKLEEFESSDEFKQGAGESLSDKKGGIQQLVENPKETAQGMSEGVGRFFKRVGRTAKTGYQTAGDILDEKTPGTHDEDGPGANLPGALTINAEPDKANKYQKVAGITGQVGLDILGFDDSRRNLARRLAVDPYTTNRVLDEKLDDVTKSIFAGDFAVDVVTTMIPGGALVSATTIATDWVWDIPPGDLYVKIEKMLLGMGVSEENTDKFLRNSWYPLSYKTLLANSLDLLKGVRGREDIFPLVLTVTTFDQARFVTNSLRMTAQYHKSVRPIEEIGVYGTLVATDADSTLVVTAPVDYMSWVKQLDDFSSQEMFKDGEKKIYIVGITTTKARNKLESRGWNINENSELLDILAG